MNLLPGFCVGALAALLFLESGRSAGPAAGPWPAGPRHAATGGRLPFLAPATLRYDRRHGDAPPTSVAVTRTDRRVRVTRGDEVRLVELAALDGPRSSVSGDPMALLELERAGWSGWSALALAGLTVEELHASRPTGRACHAFGLEFEERTWTDARDPSRRSTAWWSAELGAPLRVERWCGEERWRFELTSVRDAPPGALTLPADPACTATPPGALAGRRRPPSRGDGLREIPSGGP